MGPDCISHPLLLIAKNNEGYREINLSHAFTVWPVFVLYVHIASITIICTQNKHKKTISEHKTCLDTSSLQIVTDKEFISSTMYIGIPHYHVIQNFITQVFTAWRMVVLTAHCDGDLLSLNEENKAILYLYFSQWKLKYIQRANRN